MLETYRKDTARRMADCTMQREGLLNRRWSYDYCVVWRGMEQLWRITGDRKYFDYIRDGMDTFIGEDGSIRDYTFDSFNLDYVCDGRQLLLLYKETGAEKYRLAADTLREQLRLQPRTPEGGFWHKQCYVAGRAAHVGALLCGVRADLRARRAAGGEPAGRGVPADAGV